MLDVGIVCPPKTLEDERQTIALPRRTGTSALDVGIVWRPPERQTIALFGIVLRTRW